MPEGDTVHKLARVIAEDLEGRELRRVSLRGLRAASQLVGSRVRQVEARGKHLLVHTDAETSVRVHLGMRGSWHRYQPGEPWKRAQSTAAAVFETPATVFVCFQAAQVELLRGARRRWHPQLTALGPDLLGPEPDWLEIVERARRHPHRPLQEVLLDQRVACGLGNVYKSELAFLGPLEEDPFRPGMGLLPDRSLATLSDDELMGLYRRGRLLMLANLGGWMRTTTVDRRRQPAPTSTLWVYERGGEPCLKCSGPIASVHHGLTNRVTYWCARCQS